MSRKDKIQHLLISHLLEEGTIQLALPDGMVVELGILKESFSLKCRANIIGCYEICNICAEKF